MKKINLLVHVSLDGFVGGLKGELDWIYLDEEIFNHVALRTDEADTALYGRKTYQMMQAYWPTAANQSHPTRHDIEHSRWYASVKKVVISRTMQGAKLVNTLIISDYLSQEIIDLKNSAGRDILMLGSPTAAHALMAENLIDDYWLYVNPVLLGKGIPLFCGFNEKIPLTLVENKEFSSGVVCLHYKIKPKN
jgi:dihydrofolate reductase